MPSLAGVSFPVIDNFFLAGNGVTGICVRTDHEGCETSSRELPFFSKRTWNDSFLILWLDCNHFSASIYGSFSTSSSGDAGVRKSFPVLGSLFHCAITKRPWRIITFCGIRYEDCLFLNEILGFLWSRIDRDVKLGLPCKNPCAAEKSGNAPNIRIFERHIWI